MKLNLSILEKKIKQFVFITKNLYAIYVYVYIYNTTNDRILTTSYKIMPMRNQNLFLAFTYIYIYRKMD